VNAEQGATWGEYPADASEPVQDLWIAATEVDSWFVGKMQDGRPTDGPTSEWQASATTLRQVVAKLVVLQAALDGSTSGAV